MVDKEDFNEFVENLKQQRDELRVKMHLAAADAKDQWDELEGKWEHFEAKARQAGEQAAEASKGIWDAARELGAEIKDGYDRIRKTL
jgi:predicted  nucleic acid-binding Zn-ribbon protein